MRLHLDQIAPAGLCPLCQAPLAIPRKSASLAETLARLDSHFGSACPAVEIPSRKRSPPLWA